jgi:hypothetical protein
MLLLLGTLVTNTDSNKRDSIQRKFAAVRYKRFSQDIEYHYDNLLERINLLNYITSVVTLMLCY